MFASPFSRSKGEAADIAGLILVPADAIALSSLKTMWSWNCLLQPSALTGSHIVHSGRRGKVRPRRALLWGDSHASHLARVRRTSFDKTRYLFHP